MSKENTKTEAIDTAEQDSSASGTSGMKKRLIGASTLLLEFIIAGFVGWVYETALTSAVFHEFVDRGVLPVPFLPIYGFFAAAMSLIFKDKNKWYTVFIVSTLGITVFEYIASVVTERIFGYMLWDYFMWPLHFQGRISVFSSLIFGVLSLIFVKAVKPFSEKFHSRYPKTAAAVTLTIFAVLAAATAIKLL